MTLDPVDSLKARSKTTVNKNDGTAEYLSHPLHQPHSVHQFISDFFRTDVMNHCEFLKQMNNFGQDDAYLITEICNRLIDQSKGKKAEAIQPFYGDSDDAVQASDLGHVSRTDFQTHKSFPRNCFNIMLVYASITQLAGHEYNVYELAYLNYHSKFGFRMALSIFLIQMALLVIVVHSNMQQYEFAFKQRDVSVLAIDICTTLFVFIFCYSQYNEAQTFTTAARGVIGSYLVKEEDLQIKIDNPNSRGDWQPELMLFLNEFVNQYAIMLAPVFNFYFILLSESAMDAVLNGFSLLFIFELDDFVLPLFKGIDIEDKLVINAHDFIMIKPETKDLSCRRIGPAIVPNTKLYVSVRKDKDLINIYSRVNRTKYNKTKFIFTGPQKRKFLSLCEESLICQQNFKDIHD